MAIRKLGDPVPPPPPPKLQARFKISGNDAGNLSWEVEGYGDEEQLKQALEMIKENLFKRSRAK